MFAHRSTTKLACWFRRAVGYAVPSLLFSALVTFPFTDAFPLFLRRSSVLGASLFGIALYLDLRAEGERRGRKTLRGTKLVAPDEFSRHVKGGGLGVPCLTPPRGLRRIFGHSLKRRYLRVRKEDETSHVLVSGDTRTGKSVLMHFWLDEIRQRREDTALVYDPALEFWECHARPERGDLLLHPLFAECPCWDIIDEIQNPLDAKALAKSFLPDRREGQPDFWDLAPQKILTFLLLRLREEGQGVGELLRWLAEPALIDEMVAGTELMPMIDPDAAPQRAGVLASLNMIAEALRLLPPDDGRPRFSFRSWAEADPWERWVFIGSRPGEREALKPLVSAWLDSAFAKLFFRQGGALTWVFVDELPTLQRLPKLNDALQEAGKYNIRFVLGFQGRAQLEQLYGKEAETLMSAPGTRVFLRTNEVAAARWCAENIGMPELERGTESLTTSAGDGRDSMSTGTERRADYLVLPNEIQNLPKRVVA